MSHITYTCASKPGCLMSHNQLHTQTVRYEVKYDKRVSHCREWVRQGPIRRSGLQEGQMAPGALQLPFSLGAEPACCPLLPPSLLRLQLPQALQVLHCNVEIAAACCSFQSQNVYCNSETSSLHWKSKLRDAWGQGKRVSTLWRCFRS